MPRETRWLRPFETLIETQSRMWEGVQITAFDPDKRAAFDGEKLVVAIDDYLSSPFTLWFFRSTADHETFAKTALEEISALYPEQQGVVHLVVTAHTKRLKMTDLLFDRPIVSADDIPLAIELHQVGPDSSRPRPLQTPGDGCEITVEFLLGRDIPEGQRQPFRGWRKGSWLARVSIGIATTSEWSGPQPRRLTDEIRSQFHLPEGALHYTNFLLEDSSLLRVETFDDALEFYVDEDVLDQVEKDPLAERSQRMQLGWILDVAKAFVLRAMQAEEFDDFDTEVAPWSGTVLRAILDKVVGAGSVATRSDALKTLREDPYRFFALLEDRAGLLTLERRLARSDDDRGAQ